MWLVKKIILLLFVGIITGQSIGFVGNSITADGYGLIVETLMPQYKTYNFGVGGITVEGYKTTNRYQDVLNTRPNIIVILLGTNDWRYYKNKDILWRDNWHYEYQSLINTFNQWSDVYVGMIPYQVYTTEPDTAIESMNDRIRGMTNKKGVIDFNYILQKNPDYFKDDGVHPNDDGKTAMAIAVWNALKTPPETTPETPKNLQAIAGDNQVSLTWDANTETDLYKYNLSRGINEIYITFLKSVFSSSTSYVDNDVTNGTTYYYRISASGLSDNQSQRSAPVSATPIDITPPSTPTIISISVFQGEVTVQWSKNSEPDLANYNIYRSTTSGFYPTLSDWIETVDNLFTEYVDSTNIEPHLDYYYWISAIDSSGNESGFSDEAAVTTLRILNDNLTTAYVLKQNTPNPFNPATSIEYTIPFDAKVNIVIYDLMGNEIKTLINDYREVGQYTINWDGTNHTGQFVSGGIYFYKLQAGDFIQTKKMVLLR